MDFIKKTLNPFNLLHYVANGILVGTYYLIKFQNGFLVDTTFFGMFVELIIAFFISDTIVHWSFGKIFSWND